MAALLKINIIDLEFDTDNNMYILGGYGNTIDLDPSANMELFHTVSGTANKFILKLDAQGDFIWAQHLPVLVKDIDPNQNIYFTGNANPPTNWLNWGNLGNVSNASIFYGKLDVNGSVVWIRNIETTRQSYPISNLNCLEAKSNGSLLI